MEQSDGESSRLGETPENYHVYELSQNDQNGAVEPDYGCKASKVKMESEPVYGNGRMSPITEESLLKNEELHQIAVNGHENLDRNWTPDGTFFLVLENVFLIFLF